MNILEKTINMAFSPSNNSARKQEPELREVSASLSEKRREKLLSIKKREEMKDVLVKKFKERVGVSAVATSGTKKDTVIEKNVDDFLEQAAITENNLKRLEKKIIKETGAEEIFEEVSNYSAPIVTDKSTAANTNSKKMASWSDLDEYAVYLYKKDAVQHKQRIIDAQANMHKQLDEQVASGMGKMDWIKEEDKKFFEASIQELEDWKLAEADKILEIKKKNIVEKNMRDEQLTEEKKT